MSQLCPRTALLFALLVLVLTSSVLFAVMLIAIPLATDAPLFRRSWRIAGAVLLCCAQLFFLTLFILSNIRWLFVGVVCSFVLLSAWTILAAQFSPMLTARRRFVLISIISVLSAAVLVTGVILVAKITSTPPTPPTPPISPPFQPFLQIEKSGGLSLRHMDKRNRNDANDVLDSPGLLALQIMNLTKTLSQPLTTCLFELDNLFYVDQVTQLMTDLPGRLNSPYPFEQVETLSIVNCRYNTFFDERSAATPTAFSTLSSMPALTTLGVHFPKDADRKTDAYTPINDVALLHHCVGKSWPPTNKITTVDCSDNAIMMQALVTPSTAMHEKMQSLFIEVVKMVVSRPAVSSFCWRRCALGTLSTDNIQTIARLFHTGLSSAVTRSTTIDIDLRDNGWKDYQQDAWTASIATTNSNVSFLF